MIDAKTNYRQFCKDGAGIPLFSQPWWLDAVCGDGRWDVALLVDGEGLLASMPFSQRRKFGFQLSTQPRLTPALGPTLRRSEASKESSKRAYERKLMKALIDQLPRFDYFLQKWPPAMDNWLPFYWEGFRQTTRYTSILDDITSEELVWRGMDQNIRAEIKKARDRVGLVVREGTIHEFLRLNHMTFARQGMALPYSPELVKSIDRAASARRCRRILLAHDDQGLPHAAVYVVWDDASAYYLMGGADPTLRNSGATSLCMWEAVRHASQVTRAFDFEGSMIEPVARFFRAFGAKQVAYSQVKRINSRILRLVDAARGGV